jgi:hypothetical protein
VGVAMGMGRLPTGVDRHTDLAFVASRVELLHQCPGRRFARARVATWGGLATGVHREPRSGGAWTRATHQATGPRTASPLVPLLVEQPWTTDAGRSAGGSGVGEPAACPSCADLGPDAAA